MHVCSVKGRGPTRADFTCSGFKTMVHSPTNPGKYCSSSYVCRVFRNRSEHIQTDKTVASHLRAVQVLNRHTRHNRSLVDSVYEDAMALKLSDILREVYDLMSSCQCELLHGRFVSLACLCAVKLE